VDLIIKDNGEELYELQDTSKPYTYNIRLKPFITAYGRNKTARVALRMIDDVIRIHTDGIAFKKPINFELDNFNAEKKTTGHIRFKNINNYERL
jgi:hypothetical protein